MAWMRGGRRCELWMCMNGDEEKREWTNIDGLCCLEHTAHTTHTTSTAHGRSRHLLLRSIDDGNLSGTQQRSNTRRINERSANNLQGINDTSSDHIDILASSAVEALVEVSSILIRKLANNDRTLKTSVLDDRARGTGDGALDDVDTEVLIEVGSLGVLQTISSGLEESSATTGQDTLLDSSACSVQCIDDTVLLLTDLDLRGTADLNDSDTAGELSKTLLELLLLVLGGRLVSDDAADLLAALGDSVLASLAVQDDGVLLGDGDGAGRSELVRSALLELEIELVGEDGGVGQDTDIAEDRLAVVAEAGGLDGSDLELATELVEDADGESLALNVLCDDDEGTAEGGRGLEGGEDVLDSRDLLLREQDQWLLELDLLGLGIGDEVRRDVAAVETHTLRNLQLILDGLAVLDGNDTFLADLLHGVGDQVTNVSIAVGGDGSDLSNLSSGGDILLVVLQVIDNSVDGGLDTAAEVHGVAAGSNVLDGLAEDGAGEDGGGGGTVTSGLVRLAGNILEKTGT